MSKKKREGSRASRRAGTKSAMHIKCQKATRSAARKVRKQGK